MSLQKANIEKYTVCGRMILGFIFCLGFAGSSTAKSLRKTNQGATSSPQNQAVYKIYDKTVTLKDVTESDKATFYELNKRIFDKIDGHAKSAFLEEFWKKEALKSKTTPDRARESYYKKRVKVSNAEVTAMANEVKANPQLSKLSKEELEAKVRAHLEQQASIKITQKIIENAESQGLIKILYPRPVEPRYDIVLTSDDPVRYGPKTSDTSPVKGSACDNAKKDCPITIVEYSEFQCGYCKQAVKYVEEVLTKYKGKVKWAVRDFPLDFHARAVPAAKAAKCAAFQNKYWEMYNLLFQNISKQEDVDLKKYGSDLGLDAKKYQDCLKNSSRADRLIAENKQSAIRYGVSGTPAFFINGRFLSGAQRPEAFSKIIDEELKKKNKS